MDCPSCARKIETAVSRVEGVTQARVLFATEKLVVDLAPASPRSRHRRRAGRRFPAKGKHLWR